MWVVIHSSIIRHQAETFSITCPYYTMNNKWCDNMVLSYIVTNCLFLLNSLLTLPILTLIIEIYYRYFNWDWCFNSNLKLLVAVKWWNERAYTVKVVTINISVIQNSICILDSTDTNHTFVKIWVLFIDNLRDTTSKIQMLSIYNQCIVWLHYYLIWFSTYINQCI